MKLKEGLILHKMAGECMMIAVGDTVKEFSGYMLLNETAEFIARQLMEDITEEALVDAVCARYEVERERVAGSVRRSLEELEKRGLLEEK